MKRGILLLATAATLSVASLVVTLPADARAAPAEPFSAANYIGAPLYEMRGDLFGRIVGLTDAGWYVVVLLGSGSTFDQYRSTIPVSSLCIYDGRLTLLSGEVNSTALRKK
jgi:hypothetical protein